ncbi:MAG TPA: ABC transporter permease [Vicinamibacterales bacterium]|nr:ABC transporter permease [Vicinamibacterales bacterium]
MGSVRALSRSPGFALVAIATLALGIGATVALFTVVHGVLLRPLPYGNADRLVVVLAEQDFDGAGRPVRVQWQNAAIAAWPTLASVERAGFHSPGVAALAGGPTSELIDVAFVTGSFFETVDGRLMHGRGLTPADDLEDAVVISERLRRRVFAGSVDVLGQSVTLNRHAYVIVGVADAAFQIPQPQTDAWIPAGFARTQNPNCCGFTVIARLRPGRTPAAATEEIRVAADALAREFPRTLDGTRVQVVPLRDVVVGDARPALLVLTAAVGLLLVLACANVMNLLLARNNARRHETSVRLALGASRRRLLAEGLRESAVLSAAGCVAGVGLAALSLRALQAWPPTGLPRLDSVALDGTATLFACLLVVACTIAVGLLPALYASDATVGTDSRHRGTVSARSARVALRTATVAQLALSVVLLAGAMLLGRSLVMLMGTDLGVTPDHVATASLNLAMDRTLTDEQQIDLVRRVVERISALPDVGAAGVGAARPPDASRVRVTLRRPDDPSERASYQAAGVPATPGYFPALGIRLERGRSFTEADHRGAPPVVIMSADTARRLFGERDPLGRSIRLPVLRDGRSGSEEMTVVGITANVKYSGIDRAADDVIYIPFAQHPWRSVFLVARTAGNPQVLVSQLQREIAAVDRAITLAEVTTLDAVLSDATAQPRFRTLLLATVAALALVIAGVGVYGVIAYSVSQRLGEIGVRMAVGADARRIRTMVLREGMVLALVGALAGLLIAYGAAGLLTSLLYGIAPTDPTSFTLAAAAILAVGLAATYLPAARAARVDPLTLLRAE